VRHALRVDYIHVVFVLNLKHRFLVQQQAAGKVVVSEALTTTLPAALLLPQKSVFEIQDKNYVFVVDQQGVVRQRNFVPQTRTGNFYVVKEGLKPGEWVVYEGVAGLRDGQRISPRSVTMDSLLALSQ
jgi:membrane fusion protein (multidrug efflux system)